MLVSMAIDVVESIESTCKTDCGYATVGGGWSEERGWTEERGWRKEEG